MFWLFAAVMIAVAAGLLLRPLVHSRPALPSRTDYDLAVYRDQLAEVDRDVTRGVLAAEQAVAARLEIERRILVAADDTARAQQPTRSTTRSPGVAAGVALALPLAALALYLSLGSPGLPGQPLADRAPTPAPSDADAQNHADIGALVTQLANRMAAKPDDPKGWMLLGHTYKVLGRYAEAADAYAKAIAHGAADAGAHAAYGEMLTMAADGRVTVAALQAFEAALAVDAKEPRARYYQALARSQAGKPQEALDLWIKLEADAPANAEWRATVAERIAEAAASLGLDPATLPGRKAPAAAGTGGPAASDMEAAANMTPDQRAAFTRSMVDRLAERLKTQPNDPAGWQQLADSYHTLGDRVGARDAWGKAAALAPTDFDAQANYAEALLGTQSAGDETLPPGFPDVVKRMQALRPKSYITLFYGGMVEKANGNTAGARAYWQELLATLPADLPIRADVQRRLDALDKGG